MVGNNNPTLFFDKKNLNNIKDFTPFFIFSKTPLRYNINQFKKYFPQNTEICYSLKANAEKDVLDEINKNNLSFEVASKFELALLKKIGVSPANIIFGSSVKAIDHIQEFVAYGVDRFAFDSDEELLKLSKYAPGSNVYVRALVNDKSNSVFHMSNKFGTPLMTAVKLLIKAKELGLVPYGISFNVGSQARSSMSWARGITDVALAMKDLAKNGIEIQVINLGGGFPQQYNTEEKVPTVEEIADHIKSAIKELPYSVDLIIEPGRALVASSYCLIVSVVEKIKKEKGTWLHIDAGVYNALLEAMAYQGSIRYVVEPLLQNNSIQKKKFILTGPACDDLDVIDEAVILPENISVGDRLIIYNTGAYSFTLSTRFNGYPVPSVIEIE